MRTLFLWECGSREGVLVIAPSRRRARWLASAAGCIEPADDRTRNWKRIPPSSRVTLGFGDDEIKETHTAREWVSMSAQSRILSFGAR